MRIGGPAGGGAEERVRFRVTVLGLVVVSLMSVLLSRLWFLQVLVGEEFAQAAERNYVRIVAVEAPRGRILDRNGRVLVRNRPSLAVGIRRDDFPERGPERRRLVGEIARLLEMTPAAVERRLRDVRVSPYKPVVIADDVPRETIFRLRERPERFPGIETFPLPVREYPSATLAAHVLGYVGETNEAELESLRARGYRLGDSIGKTGVERTYERWLRGRPGLDKLEVDATGRVLRSLGSQEALPGADLTLTLDAEVQEVAEEALALGIKRARSTRFRETGEPFEAPAGGVVVLDARTGEVVAMASAPTFDPRRFVGGVDADYFRSLNAPESNFPFLNRAMQAPYPPGSTIKPVTSLAALASGAGAIGSRYPCTSEFEFGDRVFRNWRPRTASITIGGALVESCDTVFYRFAVQWWLAERRAERAGRPVNEVFAKWLRTFGLGAPTGIDLPQEAEGVVPDRAKRREDWERNRTRWCNRWERERTITWEDLCLRGWLWRGGDAVNTSIGQGEIEATPLQMAALYAAVANGGTRVVPHVVKRIEPLEGRGRTLAPKPRGTVKAAESHLRYVRGALADVPTAGTARFPFRGWPFSRVSVAAKTGSAEIAGKQPFSWFAAYAPASNPRYVVVSVVEQAGSGSQVSGPVVRRIMDKLFGFRLTPVVFGSGSD